MDYWFITKQSTTTNLLFSDSAVHPARQALPQISARAATAVVNNRL
jgi:hypothetical protein